MKIILLILIVSNLVKADPAVIGFALGMATADNSSSRPVVKKVILKKKANTSCFIEVPYVGNHFNHIIPTLVSVDSINYAYERSVDGYIDNEKKKTEKFSITEVNIIGIDDNWRLKMKYAEFKNLLNSCEK